jgi:lipoic acid synthetase
VDWDEPKRVADAIKKLGLRHVVITSVNRDELKDGGSSIWAETIHQVRRITPNCTIEVLIPDFKGSEDALMTVLGAKPNILAHNTETVPRLYKTVRPQANYRQSLEVLKRAKTRGFITKTGVMLGLGEEIEEVYQVMTDLRDVDCDILTLGQYLRPSKQHLPIVRYYHPDEFVTLKIKGEAMGFKHVESGPLVRSSYHADEQVSQRPEPLEIKL